MSHVQSKDIEDNYFDGDIDQFEARADHIDEEVLRSGTSTGDWFEKIHSALLSRRTTVIVGPRGCGKTHMMRYTWLHCRDNAEYPLSVYVSFNRYLRLEPWMQRRSDARSLFNAWVLALIMEATIDVVEKISDGEFDLAPNFSFDRNQLNRVIEHLESHIAGDKIDSDDEDAIREINVSRVVEFLRRACRETERNRAVILLDDAALTLTPDFLVDFFDVVRTIKKNDIAPKCSVYPGTTHYGPRFHVNQEADVVPAWLSVDAPKYQEIMGTLVELRNPQAFKEINKDTSRLLMFAAFGVPRAYLVMMSKLAKSGKQSQADINQLIQVHVREQRNEYLSIEQKLPQFSTIVKTGENFFDRIVEVIVEDNVEKAGPRDQKQIMIGIEAKEFPTLASRMIKFLIEAGLLYELLEVKHGGHERTYRRFIPHMAALISARAFSNKSHGASASAMVAYIERTRSKHPVRRKLTTLLTEKHLNGMQFDLPACPSCGATRLTETQKFCHECASQLPQPSTYFRLMQLPIDDVPILTRWARDQLKAHGIARIQDLMALEDPGTELRKIHRVGPKRAERYLNVIESHVNETLLT